MYFFFCLNVCHFRAFVLAYLLEGTNDEDKNDSEDETQQRRAYSLREHKPRTQLYIAPAIGNASWFDHLWKSITQAQYILLL